MAGTMVYMFMMLALGSGMVVLMFGFSSTHNSMYTLQASFDEQDKQLRRTKQANADMTSQISSLQKTVEEMRTAQQKLQAVIDNQAAQLATTGKDIREEVSSQVRRFEKDLSRLREGQQAATSVEDDLKLQTRTYKASSEAIDARVSKAEERLEKLSSKDEATSEKFALSSKVLEHMRGLFERLSQSVDEIRRQQAAQASQLEDVRHQPVPTVAPPRSSSVAANAASPSADGPAEPHSGWAQQPSSSSARSAARAPGGSSSSSRHPPGGSGLLAEQREDHASGREASESDHHALNYRRTPDHVDDDAPDSAGLAEQSTSPSPTPALAVNLADEAYQISWYRECGCTGMEIEAVTLLVALVHRLGAGSVRVNKCSESCQWPASIRSVLDKIEVFEDSQLTDIPTTTSRPGRAPVVVLVIHAAFSGVCGVPDSLLLPARSREVPISDPQRGLLRVSRSMLETDRLDEDAARACNEQFDAVWVPSQFNVRTFSGSGVAKEKLHVLPEAVDTTLFNCSVGRYQGSFGSAQLDAFVKPGAGEDYFTFLSIFKWEERKNWRVLLESFVKAFPDNVTEVVLEDGRRVKKTVRLLIKTQELSWGSSPDEDVSVTFYDSPRDLKVSISERILIFKDALPTDLMPSLYHVADAFVLPTHGEGWGLPLMEAMAAGLPTIATNWGGQTEFMNDKNAYVLGYEMVQTNQEGGHLWAEPNATELRQAMWDVVRQGSLARSRAERGCREVHTLFTPEATAHRAVGLIAQLHGNAASRK